MVKANCIFLRLVETVEIAQTPCQWQVDIFELISLKSLPRCLLPLSQDARKVDACSLELGVEARTALVIRLGFPSFFRHVSRI